MADNHHLTSNCLTMLGLDLRLSPCSESLQVIDQSTSKHERGFSLCTSSEVLMELTEEGGTEQSIS
ncbi:hypothetical protein Mapa_001789 [Marchantia paleacea]|nr:hypothetical protein Mapa_001789 [Marchantia paleacea]